MVGKDPFDHDVKGGETQDKTVSLALQHTRCKVANCDNRINDKNNRRRGEPEKVSPGVFLYRQSLIRGEIRGRQRLHSLRFGYLLWGRAPLSSPRIINLHKKY